MPGPPETGLPRGRRQYGRRAPPSPPSYQTPLKPSSSSCPPSSSITNTPGPSPTPPPPQPTSQNVRDDGYMYLQVEIGFDRQLPAPWANSHDPPSHFCMTPHPSNLGHRLMLPGPHRHCQSYYSNCDHRSSESFVMYNFSPVHNAVASFMVLVPVLLQTRPVKMLDLVCDAIEKAFPQQRERLENYNEVNISVGADTGSRRICVLRQMRRICMALVLFGDGMVEHGAFSFSFSAPPPRVGRPSAEDEYSLIVHLDGCYSVEDVMAAFLEGGVGGELRLARYWQRKGCLERKGTVDLISYNTYVQDVVIRGTLERLAMFLWSATHTSAGTYMAWALSRISQPDLDRFGCAMYGQVGARDLDPERQSWVPGDDLDDEKKAWLLDEEEDEAEDEDEESDDEGYDEEDLYEDGILALEGEGAELIAALL